MLEEIILPAKAGDLLRAAPVAPAEFISKPNVGGPATQGAGEFWKECDAQQAAGK